MEITKGGKAIGIILLLAAIACAVVFTVRYVKSRLADTVTIELSDSEITF